MIREGVMAVEQRVGMLRIALEKMRAVVWSFILDGLLLLVADFATLSAV